MIKLSVSIPGLTELYSCDDELREESFCVIKVLCDLNELELPFKVSQHVIGLGSCSYSSLSQSYYYPSSAAPPLLPVPP